MCYRYEKSGGQVDLILTDPPYNISVKNNLHTMRGHNGIDFGEWDKGFDLTGWIPVALNNLKSGGSIIIFSDWKKMTYIVETLQANDCLIKEMIQWHKVNPMPRNRDRLYVTSCEFAIWATKGKGWTFNRQRNNFENTVFTYPIVSGKNRLHPTQKPEKLMEDLILIHSNKGETIFDPFMGSGTTGVAALNTGRNFIGYELDEKYYQCAKERIEKCFQQ